MGGLSALAPLHEHTIDIPEDPVRHDARLHVAEPVAHRQFDGLDGKPDGPGLVVDDVLDSVPPGLLHLPIPVRQHLIEDAIDARLVRRRRLLLADEPEMRLARRPIDILSAEWRRRYAALNPQQP